MKKEILAIVSCGVLAGLPASAQTLAVQLKASNYNPTTGVWTDSSGNSDNATYSGSSAPTVLLDSTPNGSTALDLTGNGSLLLGSSLPYASGYTIFAFIEPSTDAAARNALTGGSSPGALEYDVYSGNQDYLQEYQADVGHGNATLPTTSYSLVDIAVSSASAAFHLNGTSDGTVAGAAFSSPITRIGNNEGGGDGFAGDVAEIDIYEGVLNSSQISSVESAFTSEYVTSVPEPSSLAMIAGGSALFVAFRRFRRF